MSEHSSIFPVFQTVAEEVLPPENQAAFEVPENWSTTKKHMERVVLAGVGTKNTGLMFVFSSVLDEDTSEHEIGKASGRKMTTQPFLLRGPSGIALKDICVSVGISMSADVYCTALCKWLLPKDKNLNPKAADYTPGLKCLSREIRENKPSIVVAFGKAAFEVLVPVRLKFADAIGCWFWSEEYQCRVMPMSHHYYAGTKPEWTERYRTDMAIVRMELAALRGVVVPKVPVRFRTVANSQQLQDLVRDISTAFEQEGSPRILSIDCEWHGHDHVDGELRSLQIAWSESDAAYIRFRDEKRKYAMDVSYKEAGKMLAPLWNRQDVKLVGHHISADLAWTTHVLGLEWYDKVQMDTEFAYQVVNEHGERGLERMSVRFTDCGRYEIDLEIWKREHRVDADDGYGLVPDAILIPYALYDVIVPYRAAPYIRAEMDRQGLSEYYDKILGPFVSNIFTSFVLVGLPVNVGMLEEMRELYHFSKERLEKRLQKRMHEEAWELLGAKLLQLTPGMETSSAEAARLVAPVLAERVRNTCAQTGTLAVKSHELTLLPSVKAYLEAVGLAGNALDRAMNSINPHVQHLLGSANFNIRSPEQLKRWLFEVKGYTPVKSTANKKKDIPAMDWAKVMAMRPDRREGVQPAVDKQTLQILQKEHNDKTLLALLELNAVGNICKAFLSLPERDSNGQITEEAGLLGWVSSDGRVHGQFSMTETGRPRAWKPNSLNWPAYLQDKVVDGIRIALEEAEEEGALPEKLRPFLKDRKVLPLRASVQAPPGTVFIESDFATAEIRALAFKSGDANLIRYMEAPDEAFGLVRHKDKDRPVRLHFPAECEIDAAWQKAEFLMAVWEENKNLGQFTEADLLRKLDGTLKHPRHDLHWSLVEMSRHVPREILRSKADRGAGKVGNFSCIGRVNLVLTHLGNIPVLDLHPDKHLVWDGVEWVTFDAIVEKPPQHTITYAGLTATVDHGVWTDDGRAIFFGEAALLGLRLATSQAPDGSPRFVEFRDSSSGATDTDSGRATALLPVQVGFCAPVEYDGASVSHDMPCLCRESNLQESEREVPLDATALREGYACLLPQLQGERDQVSVLQPGRFHQMGSEHLPWRDVQRQGFRPNRQQRPLLSGESSLGESAHESEEHAGKSDFPGHTRAQLHTSTPGDYAETAHDLEFDATGSDGRADCSTLSERRRTTSDIAEIEKMRTSDTREKFAGATSGDKADDILAGEAFTARVHRDRSLGKMETLAPQCTSAEHTSLHHVVSTPAPGSDVVFLSTEPAFLFGAGCGGCSGILEQPEQQKEAKHSAANPRIHGVTSGVSGLDQRTAQDVQARFDGESNLATKVTGLGRPKEELIAALRERGFVMNVEPVYDLINAGPRHRFTAGGLLVSNSAYGATGTTLERKIEADTGVKPAPGTGQALLDALARRQPVATAYLKSMEELPEKPGFYRADSGRLRHFILPPESYGYSPRLRASMISAQGREARNFPMQESVAATAMRAGNAQLQFARRFILQGVPLTVLYDSILTWAPLEERFIWAKAHELCMHLANGWLNHGRVLRYPIDTEMNVGWSLKPKEDHRYAPIARQYDDPEWVPTPPRLKPLENWLDQLIEHYSKHEFASLGFCGLA